MLKGLNVVTSSFHTSELEIEFTVLHWTNDTQESEKKTPKRETIRTVVSLVDEIADKITAKITARSKRQGRQLTKSQ